MNESVKLRKMKSLFIIVFIFTTTLLYSQQTGIIRGQIVDYETEEPVFFANIVVKGTTIGAAADQNGKFEFSVPSGKKIISISFIGYNTLEIEDVHILTDQATVLDNIRIKTNSISLQEVTISAEAKKNTEAAILTVKRKSTVLMDGISAQTIKKSGDGNVAAAVKRVAGVSIANGKYVYVRGLGDRYTKTQLNSMDLPGLDPDRNAIQIDIFPTNIIDNIKVYKSFSANLPADFAGGVVDIETKAFPENKNLNISSSIGYNSNVHFNKNFLTYNGGKYDYIGINDGIYTKPLSQDLQITQVDRINNYKNLLKWSNAFSKTLSTSKKMSLMDGGFTISGGNQIKIKEKKIGYIGAFSFKTDYDYYSKIYQNYWRKSIDQNIYDLEPAKKIEGKLGSQNVNLSLMTGAGLKTKNSKFKINLLYIKNTEKKAGVFYGENFFSNINLFKNDILAHSERSLTNIILSGAHNFKNGKKLLEWKISPTFSQIRDNDLRETPYLMSISAADTSYSIDVSNVGNPTRMWRFLDEVNIATSSNFLSNHEIFNKKAKFKTGFNYVYKYRNYNVLGYSLTAYESGGQMTYTGNPDEIMNTLLNETNSQVGFHVIGGEQLSNKYEGEISNTATYISEEFFITKKLKSILGIRTEYYIQYYTGENQANEKYNNQLVLKDFGFFPSMNLIYSINEKTKIRTAISRTTARPSFKEKSLATIYDGISTITFNGNIDLQVSKIDNIDFRYEIYWEGNQTAAFSFFHKKMYNPIEITSFRADPDNVQPINSKEVNITGVELEFRKNIYSDLVNNLSLTLNTSIINSKSYIVGEELNSRLNNLRNGEKLNEHNGEYYREMQGQAPYIINISLAYQNKDIGLQSGLYYNVQGRTLSIVSMNANPDIYTSSFHSVNFNLNQKINSNITIGFSADNILNQNKNMVTSSYNANEEIFKSYNPGRFYNFKISYTL